MSKKVVVIAYIVTAPCPETLVYSVSVCYSFNIMSKSCYHAVITVYM